MDSARVDRWVWAIRLYKTRVAATDACKAGHVKVNGVSVKPAHIVRAGDRIEAFVHDRQRILEVVQLIDKRVGPSVAAECVIDTSPPPPPKEEVLPPVFGRLPRTGRPTKRERRDLDKFRQ